MGAVPEQDGGGGCAAETGAGALTEFDQDLEIPPRGRGWPPRAQWGKRRGFRILTTPVP